MTKKFSKEFSKTESRILGALSKLDEFLLNPQVRTCSVAAHGTSRNSNSENRETHGDRSLNDSDPEVGYFPHHSGQLNSPEAKTNSHMVTEDYSHLVTGNYSQKFPTAPLLLRQANRRRRAPQVNHNFAVRIPLRQLRQTRFCWPFSNWQRTPIQPISTTTLAESRNCLNLSQQQCLRLMGNQRNSNCLKICSK